MVGTLEYVYLTFPVKLFVYMKKKSYHFSIIFFLSFAWAPYASAQGNDINILRAIHSRESNFGDYTFSFLSASTTPMAIGVPVSHFIVGKIKKNKELEQKSYVMGIAIVSSMIFSTGLKYSINRERPYITYPDIVSKSFDKTPSFPSGHTTSAFATATSLSLAWPRWYVIVPAYTWAAGVGYSRLYLGVHYPTDVLAGAILGAGTSYLTWKVNRWLRK